MFSATDRSRKMLVSWKDLDSPKCTRRCAGTLVIGIPQKFIAPCVGLRVPLKALNNVVFPAPFGPITECSTPLETDRSRSAMA